MKSIYEKKFQAKIDQISAALKKPSAALSGFVSQFYAKLPLPDIQRLEPEASAQLAKFCHEFISKRKNGQAKITVLSPEETEKAIGKLATMVLLLNDNKPFLVDSLTAALVGQGFTLYEIIHPIFKVKRDTSGKLSHIERAADFNDSTIKYESLIYFLISPLPESIPPKKLESDLTYVLDLISASVKDWPLMVKKEEALQKDIILPPSLAATERKEIKDFLNWLVSNNFVFLGYEEFTLTKKQATLDKGTALGISRIWQESGEESSESFPLPAEKPPVIEILKSGKLSRVHRPVPMDLIRITGYDDKGNPAREYRFYGLFTSHAYYQSADQIPFIRLKISQVMEQAAFDPTGHSGKSLRAILEFFPRDELFQITGDELYSIALGIMSLEARPDVGLFIREDAYERFYSCLVFLPRDRFNTFVRKEIATVLEDVFGGEVTGFYTQMTESPLARIHLIIKAGKNKGAINEEKLHQRISDIVNYWVDKLRTALTTEFGNRRGETIYRMFQNAYSKGYINTTTTEAAVLDIQKITESRDVNLPQANVFSLDTTADNRFHLKIYTLETQTELSDILPVLDHMGCKVVEVDTFTIRPAWDDTKVAIIRNFSLMLKDESSFDLAAIKPQFEEALLRLWAHQMESDDFNMLILKAGLDWRQVTMLRTIGKYLKQTSSSYSESYFAQVLATHASVACQFCAYFDAKFNPAAKGREGALSRIEREVEDYLADVRILSEDTALRHYLEVLQAALRTNYYQPAEDGLPKSYLSIKLDSTRLSVLPLPKPFREIFVYSPRVEGIHLRSGRVARGGLRWSDRHEDFRTEVLGLMKAQKVKNAVIVPVGAKGGFIVKKPAAETDRKAWMAEGIECYKTYLRGLLDITDNIVGGKTVPPQHVVRHDEDDPYLVVAADKGTASFSDIANGISEEYHFWLGDAFASGGSVGYDHKEMAITARGAWISVERHFNEMGKDIKKESFTVMGIGDMAGDVFGNGMLLSKQIKLVGAFNHKHIFLDPSPDPAESFKERKRLFHLAGSGWSDYDTKKISAGGGVFERAAKTIKLSPQVKKLLGTEKAQASPDEVIQLMLKAEVDLLWNGGIGTFVKAETESHESVGDRANNQLRINGMELRCKVVGEGGNLGFTQRGRIEYAKNGGRINTDAIDNSAGVDCSDHEVNIKIALSDIVRSGKLSLPKRDALLVTMTDEVATLVLRDNRLQTQAITIAQHQGFSLLEPLVQMMKGLETEGLLNRALEFLPQGRDIHQQRSEKRGLTRPELAVLLSYAKLSLYDEILDSNLPDADYCIEDLLRYFPEPMQDGFNAQILKHPLRREIIATSVTNSIINRAGINFFHSMKRDTGRQGCDIARAYIVSRDAFELRGIWEGIEALDGKIPATLQMELFLETQQLMSWATTWFLRHNENTLDVSGMMARYAGLIREFIALLPGSLPESWQEYYHAASASYQERGVPKALALKVASLDLLKSACDVAHIASLTRCPMKQVAETYYKLGDALGLSRLHTISETMVVDNAWDEEALQASIYELYNEQQRLTLEVVRGLKKKETTAEALTRWRESQGPSIQHFGNLTQEILSAPTPQLSMFFLVVRELRHLGRGQ